MELCRRRGERFSFWMDGVAEDFGDTIKAMVRGEILARFEADMGEVWDMDQLLRKHEGDWPDHISRVFNLHNFEVPNGGWDATRAEYYIETIQVVERRGNPHLYAHLLCCHSYALISACRLRVQRRHV